MNSELPTRKKRTLWPVILGAVILLLAAGLFTLRSYLGGFLEERLIDLATEQTNGYVQLNLEELSVSLLAGGAEIRNLNLSPADTTLSRPNLSVESLEIRGFAWLPFLLRGDLHLDEVRLIGPQLRITAGDTTLALLAQQERGTKLSEPMRTVVERFHMEDGSLRLFRPDSANSFAEMNDLTLNANDLLLGGRITPESFLSNLTEASIQSGEVRFRSESGMYTLSADGALFSLDEQKFVVDSLRLTPNYPKYNFSRQHGRQVDRMELLVDQITFTGLDSEMLFHGGLFASGLEIRHARFDAFRNKDLPRGPRRNKEFPHVSFLKMPVPVTIDTVSILESDILYTQHHVGVSHPGTVSFLNTNGTLLNLTNDPIALNRNSLMTLDLTTEVMGSTLLSATFDFPLHSDGQHTARGRLERMEVNDLNPILEPVGLVRAERGLIHSMEFEMDLRPERSTGWVELVYSDLRIDLLRPENVDDGRYRRIISWAANHLKIKDNNDEIPYRRGEISYQRIERKSIFNYWWKSLSSGLKENVGI